MAGLLDSKSRIMDVFLTPIGRDQALKGGLRFRFATLSDHESRYQGDKNDVAIKTSTPLGIESNTSPWDQIILTTDESDFLLSFVGNGISISSEGTVVTGSSFSPVTGSTAPADYIFDASLDSLKNLQILSSENLVFDDPGLSVEPKSFQFSITNNVPFDNIPSVSSINKADSLFQDFRLSNVPNFQFLPPTQRVNNGGSQNSLAPLGNFKNPNEIIVNQQIPVDLSSLENAIFSFSRKTENNQLVIQVVEETNENRIIKLDVIKWGSIGISEFKTQKDLYFVGKVFIDGFDVPTFINIFTLVLE